MNRSPRPPDRGGARPGIIGTGLQPTALFGLCAASLVLAHLLGGGTRPALLSDAILQLLCIPLLIVAGHAVLQASSWTGQRAGLVLLSGVVILPLVQLIPLPPAIWSRLPSHEAVRETYSLLEVPLPWWPLTLSPSATMQSALALIPPVAIFLATLRLGWPERRLLILLLVGLGLVSVVLGLLQFAQGPQSALRFYDFTNPTEAVGFFANRNHFAAVLYATFLFAAVWAVEALKVWSGTSRTRRVETRSVIFASIALVAVVLLVSGQMMARSRAGLGLMMVALAGALALALLSKRRRSEATSWGGLAAMAIFAVLFALQFSLYRILARFQSDPFEDARVPFARNTLEAALAHLPFGSGLGTFVDVYGRFEAPRDAFGAYANRAHNDLLEVLLETGVPGAILIIAGLICCALRARTLWATAGDAEPIDRNLARAATLVIALLLLHSLVDYPLRTASLATLAAFSAALMCAAPPATVAPVPQPRRTRRLSRVAASNTSARRLSG